MQVFVWERRFVYDRNTIFEFCVSEFIVRIDEHSKNGYKGFRLPIKTAAAASQAGYIIPKVSVCAFNVMRIFLVIYVANVFSAEYYVQIYRTAVGAISFSRRDAVNHRLQRP